MKLRSKTGISPQPASSSTVRKIEARQLILRPLLDIEIANETRVLLDEGEAQLGPPSHQALDKGGRGGGSVRRIGLGEDDAQQVAAGRIHGGAAQLRRQHLAQAFEAADLDLLALELLGDDAFALGIVLRIDRIGALLDAVERRLRQEEVAVLDEGRHLA